MAQLELELGWPSSDFSTVARIALRTRKPFGKETGKLLFEAQLYTSIIPKDIAKEYRSRRFKYLALEFFWPWHCLVFYFPFRGCLDEGVRKRELFSYEWWDAEMLKNNKYNALKQYI